MENLVIEHKEKLKSSAVYLLVVCVLAAVLIVSADRFVLSTGTWILIGALVIELFAAVTSLIAAFTKETLSPEGITVQNVFGSKCHAWEDIARFEILWDYTGKRLIKKEQIDAPYILLKLASGKKLRFDYLEAIDQCIRCYYGQPHKDDWTNIGK